MNDDVANGPIDWQQHVRTMATVHRLQLDEAREAEVVLQMQRIHLLAQRFIEFPLAADVEPAPTFRP